jgi:AcrR family transcriptional regulator
LSDKPAAPTTDNLQPTTAKGRATRQAILDAAEEVFGELSYDRASISEITRRAGVAQGTFYLYFPDKQAAFVELVQQLNHDLRTVIRKAIVGVDDRIEMERTGLQTFFEYVIHHKSLYRIVRESQFVAPEAYRWHYMTLAKGYVAGLEAAQERGQITREISAENLAWVLMGISEFAGGRWVLWEKQPPPPEVFDDIMRFIERAMRPEDTA